MASTEPLRRTCGRVAVAAPAAVVAVLIAGGCGGDSEPDRVASSTVAATATQTGATTAGGTPPPPPQPPPPSAKGPATKTPPAVKVPRARAKLGRTQKFSGSGDRVLGTLKLARSAVVRWTVSGASFEVRDGAGKLEIAGKGKTGQTFAASGSYTSVKVTASGRWTLSFTSLGS